MNIVQKQFDHSAATYDIHAIIQQSMAEHVLHLAQQHDVNYSSILDVGCGTGLLTYLFSQAFPYASITALDIAENMLSIAQKKINNPCINFIHQDVEGAEWKNTSPYHLIISNAVFQWFQQPQTTINKLMDQVQPGGILIASTFGPETFIELTSLFNTVEYEMGLDITQHHLPLKTRENWYQLFKEAGCQSINITSKKEKLSYPDCRSFLQSIKGIGASCGEKKHPLSIQRTLLREVISRYDSQFRIGDKVYTTYDLLYITASRHPKI